MNPEILEALANESRMSVEQLELLGSTPEERAAGDAQEAAAGKTIETKRQLLAHLQPGDILVSTSPNGIRTIFVVHGKGFGAIIFGVSIQLHSVDHSPTSITIGSCHYPEYFEQQFNLQVLKAEAL